MANKHLLLLAAASLALAGCTTLPPPEAAYTVDLPQRWEAALSVEGTLAAAPWWASFGDPTLSALAQQATQNSTRIQSARAALRQARALRDGRAAALGPTLGLSASAQRGKTGTAAPTSAFALGLDAAFEPLADRSALDAAAETTEARAANLAGVQVAVLTELGLAYVDLRSTQERLLLAQQQASSQQETLDLVNWRLQAGLLTQGDADQAATATALARAQLPPLRTRIEQGMHAVALLTGQAPAAWMPTLAAPTPLPQAPAGLALSLPADTLAQRADVRAAEHEVNAAWARVAQAHAAQRPVLRLGGSLGLKALTLSGLSAGSAFAAAVLGSVSWPVFDSGATQAQVAAQQAAFDGARIAWQGAVLGALGEVEDALVALRDAQARVPLLQQAAQAAARAAALALQRFGTGLADYQAVLETQRTAYTTQDALAMAQATLSSAHLRLFQALGGGWSPDAAALEPRLKRP